jgi:hypothetical protein
VSTLGLIGSGSWTGTWAGSGLTLGLALLCALLSGIAGRSLRGGLYAGLVLALGLPMLLPADGTASEPERFPPAQFTQLVLPDLWQPLPVDAPNLVTATYEPEALSLQSQGLAPSDGALELTQAIQPGRLHLGITALCLALMACVGVKGAAAWVGRALMVAGLSMVWAAPGDFVVGGLVTTAFGLTLLAGLALGSLKPIGPEDPVSAALFLGAVAVIAFGGLAGWAAWAGSVPTRDVVQPLLARLAERGAPPPTPLAVEATAAHLVRVLDQGALAALAAMTALLLHLKGRRLATAVLVFLVTAGELLVARFGWPLG